MSTDRYFYDPGPLAIGKGIAYALAFFTAIRFENVSDDTYYLGIIMYFCGIICDYIELAAYKKEKCLTIRRLSLIVSVLLGLVVVFSLAVVYNFEKAGQVVCYVKKWHILINLVFTCFWTLPLWNGLVLAFNSIQSRDSEGDQSSLQYPVGFKIKP